MGGNVVFASTDSIVLGSLFFVTRRRPEAQSQDKEKSMSILPIAPLSIWQTINVAILDTHVHNQSCERSVI